MQNLTDILREPMPWYIAGPLIGLMVPLLFILENKKFGISSSFRHICAACLPSRSDYFNYDWKKAGWNLLFVAGVVIGGFTAGVLLENPNAVQISEHTLSVLNKYGIAQESNSLLPGSLFSWEALASARGLILVVAGGFLVGFGTRYAGGCTSGHSITGISMLRPDSLVATVCFFIGGLIMTHFILPFILKL